MRCTSLALCVLACASTAPPREPQVGVEARDHAPGGNASASGSGAPAPSAPSGAPALAAPLPAPGGQASPERAAAPVGLVHAASDALERGQYEMAIHTARQALRRDERYVPAMVVLAKGYYQLRKYDLASAILDIASGIDEGVADIHYVRGFLALADGAQPAAMASFRRATELDPGHADALAALGAVHVQAKNYREAVSVLEQAVKLAPSSAGAQLNLGSAYRGAAEYSKAEAAYRRALELRAGYPEAHFDLGILYLDAPEFPGLDTTGRLNAAIEQFNRYKERQSFRLAKGDPVDGYIEEARKGIERERKRIERERGRKGEAGAPKTPAGQGKR